MSTRIHCTLKPYIYRTDCSFRFCLNWFYCRLCGYTKSTECNRIVRCVCVQRETLFCLRVHFSIGAINENKNEYQLTEQTKRRKSGNFFSRKLYLFINEQSIFWKQTIANAVTLGKCNDNELKRALNMFQAKWINKRFIRFHTFYALYNVVIYLIHCWIVCRCDSMQSNFPSAFLSFTIKSNCKCYHIFFSFFFCLFRSVLLRPVC